MNANGWRAKEEAEKYDRAMRRLQRDKLGLIVKHRIDTADTRSDCELAMDYWIEWSEGCGGLGARIRYRNKCHWRQLTIRSRVPSGAKTELDKVRAGYMRWCLYAWVDPCVYDRIPEWVIVAMDPLRDSGLLDDGRPEKPNTDGTWFVPYGPDELISCGAVVGAHVDWQAAAKRGVCRTCGDKANGGGLRPARWRSQDVQVCVPCWSAL
jgi:hypothetical protein